MRWFHFCFHHEGRTNIGLFLLSLSLVAILLFVPPAEPILSSRPTRTASRRAQWLSRTRTSRAREGLSLTATSTAAGWDTSGDQLAQNDGRCKLERNKIDRGILYGHQSRQRWRVGWRTNPSSQFRFPTSLGPLGTGTGKFCRATIECRDCEPIKLPDHAYKSASFDRW